jgi:16S rRNA (adenine1518-N6/adenine1519-N6)-dimethyltransferase
LIIPKKSLGQNFLQDKNIIKKIIGSLDIKNKNIIEIGPGLGALTNEIIVLNPKKLLLIEKDLYLYNFLLDKHKDKINIINGDAINYDFSKLYNFNIISNLPYNISSKFLLKIIKFNKNINKIVCMIQSELAIKFDYRVGKMNKYKFLSKYCSDYKILFNVSSNVFYPKPKVNSKVVIFLLKRKSIDIENLELFVKLFFINKRKKIKSNKNFFNIIDKKYSNLRYEDLEYKDILEIYKRFNFSIS